MARVLNISGYLFAPLDDLEAVRVRLHAAAEAGGVKGTVLLAPEGINVFVAGARPAIEALTAEIRRIRGLETFAAKESESENQPFGRLRIKIKREIIAFGVAGIDPARRPASRVAPATLKQWLDEGRPVVLLDTRNDYEVAAGTFRGAVPAGIRHFRDFPRAVAALPESLKSARVVTFCTGGIRCEKAAPFLQAAGFQDVHQLDGGILKYFETCGNAHYDGACFVFDERGGVDSALKPTPVTDLSAQKAP